ncbi:MAG: hypothetical protein JXA77_15120 [Bacteroidales bacterium]|nr:hypothetical protein [Bacteroidales bacterium]MBN2819139.1 hypothetical protein [Bacteroidales bacterium]
MEKQKRLNNFVNKLGEIKDDISPSDFLFYNMGHFPLIYKNLLARQDSCTTCKEKLICFEKLVNGLPGNIAGNPGERKKFEAEKTLIEEHLKRNHNMHFPGYYTSLGSLLGIVLAGIAITIINVLMSEELFNRLTLIGFTVGIVVGRLVGVLLDKNIFKRNLQL